MQNDLVLILRVYLITLLWQVGFWPLVRRFFKESPDQGWAVTRVIFSLLVALLTWELAYLKMPVNTGWFLNSLAILFGLVGVWQIKKAGQLTREVWKNMALTEYLFILGLGGISLMRGFMPNIDSLEKFMDYGFVKRYMMSPTLPAMDMWWAGSQINYYSFGHFYSSVLIRMWGVEIAKGYNLVLGFLAGSGLSISYAVIRKILGKEVGEKKASISSFLGSLMVVFGGNGHSLWYLLKNKSMNDYWYADATRFIHNTIHEFPSYSFVVADLHGHLIDLPFVLLFLYLLVDWVKKPNRWLELSTGTLFGVMMMTNTWDVAVYGLLLTVIGVLMLWKNWNNFPKLIYSALVMVGGAVAVSVLWWWSFESISNGIAIVKQRSPLWQLGVLWSLGLVINLITWWVVRRSENKKLLMALSITTILLIIIPELVYAKDIYPDHPRANTMFKLTYQASILIGLMFGVMMGKLKKFEVLVGALIFGGAMIFPFQSFPMFYDNFKQYKGVDGESWIKKDFPEKWEMISYLRQDAKQGNLVEAVGDSYTKQNMISVFTGIPTIQGWRVHEWLWRGGYGKVAERESQVREIYEGKDLEKTKFLIKKYQVKWIIVGEDERKGYKINHEKLRGLGGVLWEKGESYIVEVR